MMSNMLKVREVAYIESGKLYFPIHGMTIDGMSAVMEFISSSLEMKLNVGDSMNSRSKGKRGELELVHVLKNHDFDVRRGQQFSGANGDADVIGISGLHIECKRVEKLNIEEAMKQSERDAREGEIPCVMHRKNHEEWKVTVRLTDFLTLWRRYDEGRD